MRLFFKTLTILIVGYSTIGNLIGQSWKPMNLGITDRLTKVYFVNDTIGYITDEYGFVHKTMDGGTNWSNVSQTAGVSDLFFFSKDTGFTVGQGIFKTVNGGTSWSTVLPYRNYFFSVSFPGNTNIGYASATDTPSFKAIIIYKTIDKGSTWNRIDSFSTTFAWPYIYFTDANNGYLGNYDGTIYKTTNAGLAWTLQYSNPSQYEIYDFAFPANDTGYAVADNGTVIKTTDGQNWAAHSTSTTDALNAVFFISVDSGYAVGGDGNSSGTILKTADGGQNWTVDLHTTVTYRDVFFPSEKIRYVCGDSGVALKFNADSVSAVDELISENGFKIYPNPSANEFTVDELQFTEETFLTIYNSFGENVYECIVNRNQKTIKHKLTSGIYFVKLQNDLMRFTRKIIIQ